VVHLTKPRRRIAVAATLMSLALTLVACSNPQEEEAPSRSQSERDSYVLTPETVPADATATVTIWTDDVRKAGLEQYKRSHPDVKMEILVVDGKQFETKIQLANKAGSGWPDIIFPLSTATHALFASERFQYFSQPMDGIVPKGVLDGFGAGLSPCTYGGHVYCLRNDLAPSVLYYNTRTLAEFGYAVPKTMDEFVELAKKVGQEHPGYLMQTDGDLPQAYFQYYQASGCPYAAQADDATLRIDMQDDRCVRASKVLDELLAAGVMRTDTLSDAQKQALGADGKVLMSINAVWRLDYTWKGWKWPAGTLGVAPAPTWENNTVGNEGGGAFILSRHAKNMKAALDIIQFMTTNEEVQLAGGTLPAYEPLRQKWLDARLPSNPLLATDPAEVATLFADAAQRLDVTNGWVAFEPQTEWPLDDLRARKTIVDSVAASFETKATSTAKSFGYTVVND
jgi:ABC-type glycerol-3-phosphate transport system substrate-binding protein